jgi:hypothetical protein
VLARAHGYADGFSGSVDRATAELRRYKERAEEVGHRAESWWAENRIHLDGEAAALRTRVTGLVVDESRLSKEVADLRPPTAATDSESHDQARLRDHEHKLDVARRELRDLRDRLSRVEATLDGAYDLARASAMQFIDYYQGLMHAYCAANRHAPSVDELIPVLPDKLQSQSRPKSGAAQEAQSAEPAVGDAPPTNLQEPPPE